eukprot:SM000029S10466  [mRNA]  locus=s29:290027:292927:+ [translate_table: standard]
MAGGHKRRGRHQPASTGAGPKPTAATAIKRKRPRAPPDDVASEPAAESRPPVGAAAVRQRTSGGAAGRQLASGAKGCTLAGTPATAAKGRPLAEAAPCERDSPKEDDDGGEPSEDRDGGGDKRRLSLSGGACTQVAVEAIFSMRSGGGGDEIEPVVADEEQPPLPEAHDRQPGTTASMLPGNEAAHRRPVSCQEPETDRQVPATEEASTAPGVPTARRPASNLLRTAWPGKRVRGSNDGEALVDVKASFSDDGSCGGGRRSLRSKQLPLAVSGMTASSGGKAKRRRDGQEKGGDVTDAVCPEAGGRRAADPQAGSRGALSVLFSHHLPAKTLARQRELLCELGWKEVKKAASCTHFVADRFVRTANMLETMVLGRPVVEPSWLERCAAVGEVVAEHSHVLQDHKKEVELSFSMVDSLASARKRLLFQGMKVVLAMPSAKERSVRTLLRSLIQAGGGQILRTSKDFKSEESCIAIASGDSHGVLSRGLPPGAAVFAPELILSGIIHQQLDFTKHHLRQTDTQQWGSRKRRRQLRLAGVYSADDR